MNSNWYYVSESVVVGNFFYLYCIYNYIMFDDVVTDIAFGY